MDRSLGFGSTPSDCRPIRTRFLYGFPIRLTLPLNVSRWPIIQKVRSHPCGLLLFVSIRFQDLFHSPPGVLFAFPSRYWFTIGRLRVFSLGGWSPHLQTGFLVSRPTYLNLSTLQRISHTGLSPTLVNLPRLFCYLFVISIDGSSDFARHYFRNLGWFLFLQLLRCFSSLRSPPIRDNHCWLGCPIRISADQCSFASSPQLFASCYVLLRL